MERCFPSKVVSVSRRMALNLGLAIMDDLFDASRLALWARSLQACQRALRQLLAERLTAIGMSETEFLVLWACHGAGAEVAIQGQLASLVGLSPAQLSAMVERLRVRGWIEAYRTPDDRRRQRLKLSVLGLDRLLEADRLLGGVSSAARCFTEERCQSLLAELEVLARACREACESPVSPYQGEAA